MHHAQHLEAVRRIVRHAFQTFGVGLEEQLVEKILIRDGFYCGRCFTSGGVRAVWFIEEHQVKFYGQDGGFLGACSSFELEGTGSARMVA